MQSINVIFEQAKTIEITVEPIWLQQPESWDETQDDLISIYNQAKELNYA